MQGGLVGSGVHCDSLQPHLLAGPDDTDSNLATVRDQNLLEACLRADTCCCPADGASTCPAAAELAAAGSKIMLDIAQVRAAGGLTGLLLNGTTAGRGPAGECLGGVG